MKDSKKPCDLELEAALVDVPIFPLPQVVLFPRALLPLHIFEPRYRVMLKDCLEGRGFLVMALIREGRPDNADGNPPICAIAGIGSIVEHQALPDGRANIVLQGRGRVRIEELPMEGPYRRARATLLEDIPPRSMQADRTALVSAAGAYAGEVRRRDPRFSFALPPNLETGAIADLCAHHLILSAEARQKILEQRATATRVEAVLRELATQHDSLLQESGGVLH